MAAGRKWPSSPKNWFSLLFLPSLSLQVIKYEQIYLEPAYFTSTGGGFRLLNGSTDKHRGRSFMSSRVLHVTKGLSTFQLPRITLGGDLHAKPGPANSSKYLSSFYQNVRSLKAVCCDRDSYVSNLQLLQDLTYGFHLDIVCLTETLAQREYL